MIMDQAAVSIECLCVPFSPLLPVQSLHIVSVVTSPSCPDPLEPASMSVHTIIVVQIVYAPRKSCNHTSQSLLAASLLCIMCSWCYGGGGGAGGHACPSPERTKCHSSIHYFCVKCPTASVINYVPTPTYEIEKSCCTSSYSCLGRSLLQWHFSLCCSTSYAHCRQASLVPFILSGPLSCSQQGSP